MIRALLSLTVALLLSACVLSTPGPIGDGPLSLAPEDWNGLWRSESEKRNYRATVVDPAAGRLAVRVERDGQPPEEVEILDVTLVSGGGGLFANISNPEGYLWFRIERQGETITIRAPDADRFRRRVEKGELSGHFKGYVVYHKAPAAELIRFLASPEGLSEFLPEPLVIHRRPAD